MGIAAGELRREGIRLFKRLAEPGYYVRSLEEAAPWAGLFGPRNNWRRPVLKVDMKFVNAFHRADLLCLRARASSELKSREPVDCYIISKTGEAWWRRQAGKSDPFRDQHQLPGERVIDEGVRGGVTHQVNLGESPLGWLSRRKGPDGTPFLTEWEVEAGEKLRRDYTFAGLNPAVTTNWTGMLAHVDACTVPNDQSDIPVLMLDARKRVASALSGVGPGLGDVLLATCCHLSGLEDAERSLGWPQRSAKIVLKIALARLAVHYGLGTPGEPRKHAHVWHAPSADQIVKEP